jgi:hypothetical protein
MPVHVTSILQNTLRGWASSPTILIGLPPDQFIVRAHDAWTPETALAVEHPPLGDEVPMPSHDNRTH